MDASPAASPQFVQWVRAAAPYIHAFRGQTFVIGFGGELVADPLFVDFIHDVNVLCSLGVRLVLVHGARPQIEASLADRGRESRYHRGKRITDRETLYLVLEAAARVRIEIEAKLSMGIADSPMVGARLDVAGGNFVTARPQGVIDGIDMQYTGEIRKIDDAAIRAALDRGAIVLVSSFGYSPTGEVFNLTLEEVATQVAIALSAGKLIFMMDEDGVVDDRGAVLKELTMAEVDRILQTGRQPVDVGLYLPQALAACRRGVRRAHLITWRSNGALLAELLTREGVGTMVTHGGLDRLRLAQIEDVAGVLALIEPLEQAGVLVRRSRELLEMEIDRFLVAEHDGTIVGCAALYPFAEEGAGELACLAVRDEYRNGGYGEALLRAIETRARELSLRRLFVLTTRTAHWFVERGFTAAAVGALPRKKQNLYNYQRRSQVYEKTL